MASQSNSSVAAIHNIICKRGDTFHRVIRYFDDADKQIQTVISACTFKMAVKNPSESLLSTLILSFEMGDGLEITGANELSLVKSESQMSVPAGVYVYDLEKTLPDGSKLTIQKGSFTIENDIT